MGRNGTLLSAICACVAAFGLSACETIEGTATLGILGATLVGGLAPTHEIEQIYYVGVFDPQDQLPPEVYRIRLHGQSSFLNNTKFASGWVRADVIDTLGTSVGFNKESGQVEITKGDEGDLSKIKTGRRLMMFGPEGFREAPANHRLVVVMGASPEAFFDAVSESLGVVSEAIAEQRNAGLDRALFEALTRARNERERLVQIQQDIDAAVPAPKGGE